jgi:uncharacterized membrane protein YdbT with pleckstrin-like domain
MENATIKIKPTAAYGLLKSSADILFSIVVGIAAIYFHFRIMVMPAILLFILACYKYLYIISRTYYITAEQIIYEKGILSKTTQYLEMYRVRHYIVTQSFSMRLLNVMQLTLLTYDKGEPSLVMKGIPKSDLAQVIRDHVQKCRNTNHIVTIDN